MPRALQEAAAWLPWAVFSLGMFLVWSVVFWRTSSFRKSTVAALVTGKTFAVVYKLAGLNRVVYTLYTGGLATPGRST